MNLAKQDPSPPPRVLAQKERSNIALFPWFTQETSDTLTLLLPGLAANILLTNNAHIPARISTLFHFSLITVKNLSVYSMNCQWAKLVYLSTVAIFSPDFFLWNEIKLDLGTRSCHSVIISVPVIIQHNILSNIKWLTISFVQTAKQRTTGTAE